MATAAIIAYYHWYYNVFTINPAKANPRMFPKSPFADHVPIAVPSFSKLNCWLVMVSNVGQAGNWQNPKINNAIPGNNIWVAILSITFLPRPIDTIGMLRYAKHAIEMNIA